MRLMRTSYGQASIRVKTVVPRSNRAAVSSSFRDLDGCARFSKLGMRRIEKGEPPSVGREEDISPDGRHRVACHGGEQIVVTNLASDSSRAFEVHVDDREALSEDCVSWASSRYLRFDVGKRVGFIDIQTMKLSYMFGEADESGLVELSTYFRWAIRRDGESIQAARI